MRRKSKVIKIGKLRIGGTNPIAIQSMTKTETKEIEATLAQIKRLHEAGCEVVRLSIKDTLDARAIKKIKRKTPLPLVADIHFDWRLAIAAIDNGIDKIRLNPGNIYREKEIKEVVQAAKAAKIPIRIGINSGSLRVNRKQQKNNHLAGAMVSSALDYLKILESFGFYDIVVSLKASDIFDTLEAYRKISKACDYPLHLGLTATGAALNGAVKSSIAIGVLLLEGIGDTIRVSLTDQPQDEVRIAKSILEALELRSFGPKIISCPTCGRCEVDLVKLVKQFDKKLADLNSMHLTKPAKVALMGCLVNGPGESKEADIGVAFGKREGLLFKKGKPFKKIAYKDCINSLIKELRTINE